MLLLLNTTQYDNVITSRFDDNEFHITKTARECTFIVVLLLTSNLYEMKYNVIIYPTPISRKLQRKL